MDESGTEAAATAVIAEAVSARPMPVTMLVDRPYLFVIHDLATATPLTSVGSPAQPRNPD